MKILKKEVIIKKDEVWYNCRFIYLKKDSWNWTKDYVSFFLLKKSGVSFFYEKTFLLKYVMWIFPLSTTIHGSKINIKGRKKRWKSHSPPLFFIIFRERSYRQKKLFKKCNRNYYCDQSHDAKVLHLNTFFYATLGIVLTMPSTKA